MPLDGTEQKENISSITESILGLRNHTAIHKFSTGLSEKLTGPG